MTEVPPTSAQPGSFFAQAGRASDADLGAQLETCLDSPIVQVVLEAVDSYVVILNEQRQILAANQMLLDALQANDPGCFKGLRPGELLGCIHAPEGPDGCGTSRDCARCGAVLAILAAQEMGEPASKECYLDRYNRGRWDPAEFQVRAIPLELQPHRLLVFVLRDVTTEKRREILERIFLHDLMNTLQGLKGWTEVLNAPGHDPRKAAERILHLADQMTLEVTHQRLVRQAEMGELTPHMKTFRVRDLLQELDISMGRHACAVDKILQVLHVPEAEEVVTDALLLGRVISNMVINALEATSPRGIVRLWFERRGGRPCFFVHNAAVIPEETRGQVFQRSFTTKESTTRGLGTYSMKLLGENVLMGKVGFTTGPGQGTRFHICLPPEVPGPIAPG